MPNWCMNNLLVAGPQEDVERFSNGLDGGTKNILTTYAPLPTENNEWDYSIAVDTWGTKWDFDFTERSQQTIDGTTMLYASFDTAWAPPTDGFVKISETFPTLKFVVTYFEPGMGFYGYDVFVDGSVVNSFGDNMPDFPVNESDNDGYEKQWDAIANWWNNYSKGVMSIFDPGAILLDK